MGRKKKEKTKQVKISESAIKAIDETLLPKETYRYYIDSAIDKEYQWRVKNFK